MTGVFGGAAIVRRSLDIPAAATIVMFVFASHPATAEALGQGADDGISLWRVVAALLLCLALAVAGAFALKTHMGRGRLFSYFTAGRSRRLQLVETLRLSHQVDLCIVTCDGRELLVAVSAHGAQLLERAEPAKGGPDEPADDRA